MEAPYSTLEEYGELLRIACEKARRAKAHTCECCAQISIVIPDDAEPIMEDGCRSIYCVVQGLSQNIQEGSERNICRLSRLLYSTTMDHSPKNDDGSWSATAVLQEVRQDSCIGALTQLVVVNRYPYERHIGDVLCDEDFTTLPWDLPRFEWTTSAGAPRHFEHVRAMMHECTDKHERCLQPPDQFVPRRLLEVPIDKTSSTVRVVETLDLGAAQWCALSYCWGGPQKARAVQGDFDGARREKTIAISSLPRTILDAILVACELEIPYLWVDVLCILQNDSEDLSRELAAMPKIYKRAILVITACTATSSTEGFLVPRAERVKYGKYVTRVRYHTPRGRSGSILLESSRGAVYTEPVDSRAWTLQESMLAFRQVRYESGGINWCCASNAHATAGINMTQNVQSTWLQSLSGWRFWDSLMLTYCNRKLSHSCDRLLALSAIAAEFQEREPENYYLAGLWKSQLPRSLFWYFRGVGSSRRPMEYRAPSWSWASIDTGKSYACPTEPYYQNMVLPSFIKHGVLQIMEVSTEPADPSLPFGNARGGHLVFDAPSIRLILHSERNKLSGAKNPTRYLTKTLNDRSLRITGYTENQIHLDAPEDDFEAWREEGEWEVFMPQAYCLGMSEFYYLLFKRLPSKEERYQRVGVVELVIGDKDPGPDHLCSLVPDISDQRFIVV